MHPRLAPGEFYGQTLKDHHAAGFRLSETRYAPDSQLASHSHEGPYFGFILQGTYMETYGRRVRACRPSMLIFHLAGEVHAQRFDTTVAQLFRVEVDHGRLQEWKHLASTLEQPAHFVDRSTVAVARRLYREFASPDAVSQLVIEGLGLELIAAWRAVLPLRVANLLSGLGGCNERGK